MRNSKVFFVLGVQGLGPVLPRGEISASKHKKGRKKLAGPGKSGAELLPDLPKKGRKGAELFSSLVFLEIIYISRSKDYIPINWFT
jgi:hypothetical protein